MQTLDRKLSALILLGTVVLAVAALYWGRPVLMPLAVAILLTFLLNPVVNAMHRKGLPRAPAVLLVVFLVFSVLGIVIFAIGHQVTTFAQELPEYKHNIRKKVLDFRMAGKGTAVERIQRTIDEIIGEIQKEDRASAEARKIDQATEGSIESASKPVPVVVEDDRSARRILPSALGPAMELLATLGLVVVLVIFMLLRHHEMRNRLIGLVGHTRLTTTTKALDEAGARISRYLLMQSIVNATYGAAVGIGLSLLGLPYALLWGFLAFMLRFIPYVGPWLGALFPIILSLAVFEGWSYSFSIVGLFIVLELFTNLLMEPLLYGQSAGVSAVALLVAVAFWTWLWGVIGLVLATPLTVCLVVLCKYIPEMEFIEMLMGDEPTIDSGVIYYQRLLARDHDEATEVIQTYLKHHSFEQVCNDVFIPALSFTKRDMNREKLTEDDQRYIFQATRELIETLEGGHPKKCSPLEESLISTSSKVRVLCCPAQDEADELALVLFRRLLDSPCTEIEVLPPGLLSSEIVSRVIKHKPAIVCIAALPPNALAPARYLCKRLRERLPDLKIIIGRWGMQVDSKQYQDELLSAGADYVATSLIEARNQAIQLIQILSQRETSVEPNPPELDELVPEGSALSV
jgi:predicted PurR-regulated permease PerM